MDRNHDHTSQGRTSTRHTMPTARLSTMVSEAVAKIEERRRQCSEQLDPDRRSALGQYFTPVEVAAFMAELLDVREADTTVLDPGAGVGSLTAALVARWARHGGGTLAATAVEADQSLCPPLASTFKELAQIHNFRSEIVATDFIQWGVEQVTGFGVLNAHRFDVVIMNPPYRKVHTKSSDRRWLSSADIDVPNVYAGFVALGVRMLEEGGQLVAITPRSFTNGPYFRDFRKLLLDELTLRRLHVFDARDVAFADSDVLQENVIFTGVRMKGALARSMLVSSSPSASDPAICREVPFEAVVRPDDPNAFLHITLDAAAARYAGQIASLPSRLVDLGIGVSTGPVVDFRAREHLRAFPAPGTVPLIYPHHLRNGTVQWPLPAGKKPNALVRCEATSRLLMPSGTYVLVKRFTSKEERRRIVAVVVSPSDLPSYEFGFENHLNIFHSSGTGLSPAIARGLATFLNTTAVDQFFRQFSGHTQVNATDLRSLRYPGLDELIRLGAKGDPGRNQEAIDSFAADVIAALADNLTAVSA